MSAPRIWSSAAICPTNCTCSIWPDRAATVRSSDGVADGEPLGRCLARLCGLGRPRRGSGRWPGRFDRLGLWLLEADFAHGDLKQDNLIVMPDGSLRLIDYDGVYLPSLAGKPDW